MTNSGTGPAHKLEQLLGSCENKALPEADAQKVVDRLDQSLTGNLDSKTKKLYFMALMKICKAYCFVPSSHLVLGTELERLGNPSEEQPNVWPGAYKKVDKNPDEEPQGVSIKVFPVNEMDENKIKRRFCREAVIWKRMSHPNILPLIGVTLSKELSVVYPWMENILDYLRENHEDNPVKLLEESVTGLRYLHGIDLVHGDLRGVNILVGDDGHACLANFGQASINREQPGYSALGPASTFASDSNYRYSPPEYLADERLQMQATRQGDIYSMGMTIYEVLTDKKPFQNCSSYSVVVEIFRGGRPEKPDFTFSRGYTEELWKLTTACWQTAPSERPAVDDLLGVLGDEALRWNPRKNQPSTVVDTESW